MFGFGHFYELLIVLIIALVIFGPKRLPELGSSLGKGIREFRKATNELQDSIKGDTAGSLPEQHYTAADYTASSPRPTATGAEYTASTPHTTAEYTTTPAGSEKEPPRA